jgi:hypothetical protein
MPKQRFVPTDIDQRYTILEWRNGFAVLAGACPDEWEDIVEMLREFQLLRTDLIRSGGNKSLIARKLDSGLSKRGWRAKRFDTRIVVDGVEAVSPTHEVDMFKGRVAVEVEWNNKDPFFDRDLNNFRLLFDLKAIDVGVIITRCTELNGFDRKVGRAKSSLGASSTHLDKLLPRLDGGGGGGCPVMVVGIGKANYVDDGYVETPKEALAADQEVDEA